MEKQYFYSKFSLEWKYLGWLCDMTADTTKQEQGKLVSGSIYIVFTFVKKKVLFCHRDEYVLMKQ